MKKMFLFLGLAGLLTLASCKKDWVCQCTDNNDNKEYHDIPSATLNDANKTCNNYEYSFAGSYNNCSVIH